MFDVECIVAIVERGEADKIVKAAKEVGATGATIFYGRGTGAHEVKKFLDISIKNAKEVILMLVENDKLKIVADKMTEAGKLDEPGRGIIFAMPVTHLRGLHHRDSFIETDIK